MPKPKFSKSQKDEIKKQAMSFWQEASDNMAPLFAMVEDCERLWQSKLPKDLEAEYAKHPDMSCLAPTDAYINLKSLRAAIRQLLFGRKPFATLSENGRPNVRSDNIIKAEWVLQSMLDEQHDGSGFESEADKAVHQALYAGITCAFTEWKRKIVRVPVRKEGRIILDPKTGYAKFQEKVVSQYAETKAIDIRRSRIDPSAESTKDARIIGYQTTVSLFELLKLRRNEGHFYDFDENELFGSTFDTDKYHEYAKGETERMERKDNETFGDKTIEVKDIRGLFRFKQKDRSYEVKDLVVHLGNNVILGVKENDLPLRGWELFDFPTVDQELNKMFPMGVVEPMFDAIIEKFVKRNQSLDEANRSTYDTYVGDASACENLPDAIEFVRGQIVRVDTIASNMSSAQAALSPLQRTGSSKDTFLEAESLEREIQKGQNLNDYVQSGNPQRQETATAVSELVSGAKSLTVQVVKILKDTFLAPVYCKHLILYNFFRGHEENTVFDNKGDSYSLSPGDVDFTCKVEIDIATSLDKPDMTRRFVEMFPVLLNDPYFDQYALRQTAVEILKLPNPDRILVPNEHLNIIIERENAALLAGVEQEVSQFDNHALHIEGHVEALDLLRDPRAAQEANLAGTEEFIQNHIEQHQGFIEKQSDALGNTKEFGGNSGNLVQPEGASHNIKTGAA